MPRSATSNTRGAVWPAHTSDGLNSSSVPCAQASAPASLLGNAHAWNMNQKVSWKTVTTAGACHTKLKAIWPNDGVFKALAKESRCEVEGRAPSIEIEIRSQVIVFVRCGPLCQGLILKPPLVAVHGILSSLLVTPFIALMCLMSAASHAPFSSFELDMMDHLVGQQATRLCTAVAALCCTQAASIQNSLMRLESSAT